MVKEKVGALFSTKAQRDRALIEGSGLTEHMIIKRSITE